MVFRIIRNVLIALSVSYLMSCFVWWNFDVWNISTYKPFDRAFFLYGLTMIIGGAIAIAVLTQEQKQ